MLLVFLRSLVNVFFLFLSVSWQTFVEQNKNVVGILKAYFRVIRRQVPRLGFLYGLDVPLAPSCCCYWLLIYCCWFIYCVNKIVLFIFVCSPVSCCFRCKSQFNVLSGECRVSVLVWDLFAMKLLILFFVFVRLTITLVNFLKLLESV